MSFAPKMYVVRQVFFGENFISLSFPIFPADIVFHNETTFKKVSAEKSPQK
jgi:hypothetical protein